MMEEARECKSFMERITQIRTAELPFAAPKSHLRTSESALVRDVLQSLQGYASSSVLWDEGTMQFYLKKGIYLSHLSPTSITRLLHRFISASTSLRRIEGFVNKVAHTSSLQTSSTLQAFAHAVSMRLQYLRKAAMEKEIEALQRGFGKIITLLNLATSMSWVCAGAEFLEQVVTEVVPHESVMDELAMKPAELASHILSYLYDKLNDFCLIQDGEEEPYRILLLLFIGSLRPLTDLLDRWLREGVLSDPFGELFFYTNRSVEIEDAAFWQHGFHVRSMDHLEIALESKLSQSNEGAPSPANGSGSHTASSVVIGNFTQRDVKLQKSTDCFMDSPSSNLRNNEEKIACPNFLCCIAKAIISAGKSLQLLQHVSRKPLNDIDGNDLGISLAPSLSMPLVFPETRSRQKLSEYDRLALSTILVKSSCMEHESENCKVIETSSMSLYEQSCQALKQLLCQKFTSCSMGKLKDEIYQMTEPGFSFHLKTSQDNLQREDSCVFSAWVVEGHEQMNLERLQKAHKTSGIPYEEILKEKCNKGPWFSFKLPILDEDLIDSPNKYDASVADKSDSPLLQNGHLACFKIQEEIKSGNIKSFPYSTIGRDKLIGNFWETYLNLSTSCILPALNDSPIWKAIFCESNHGSGPVQLEDLTAHGSKMVYDTSFSITTEETTSECANKNFDLLYSGELAGTDYGNGSGCGNLCVWHAEQDLKLLEQLFPYPTTLPCFQEGVPYSELSQAESHQRVASLVLHWLQKVEFKATPLPVILVQECLISFIQMQVEDIGIQVLDRLMGQWRLMEELVMLRAIYLIGSGDLLQQFCSVLFGKLDRGEPWDDFYELNTMLQESVRSSADGMVLPALDSLVVMLQPKSSLAADNGHGSIPLHFLGRGMAFGIDTLDSLYFIYKVAWPLELIIDDAAIKKYNQVMNFLLKVKRAKFALDKACRWMWKDGGGDAANMKQQLLLQQKLMHFVNTLHQYVMDRVLYSAWVDLCESMSSASSLDEVIAFHDAYLVAIQRQCLVAPDRLWALIASRVRTILGLALDFYSVQRTLRGGGAASSIKARSQLEIDRIARQFDECIIFLLRVLSFKLNVGHFPHLAELVTRINFNYYYMSESGHLLTPLPEISSGRGG